MEDKETKATVKKEGETKFLLRLDNETMIKAKAKAVEVDRSLNGFIANLIKQAI